jgi:hypothetical protein
MTFLAVVTFAPGGVLARSPGWAPCWLDRGALVVSAAFGEIAGDFLLDPATSESQVHETRAQMARLGSGVVTRDLRIAGRLASRTPMRVADLDVRTRDFDTTVNGVIGADVIGRFTMDIRWRPCGVRLWSARPGPPRGSSRIALVRRDGLGLVPAIATDGLTIRQGDFAIETADWASRIADATLSRPPVAKSRPAPARLRAMEVAGELFEEVPANLAGADDVSAGAIGAAVWTRWNLRLDLRDGWLALTPAGRATHAASRARRQCPTLRQTCR